MFLHLCVILFTGGVCLSANWATTVPGKESPPARQDPPGKETHPSGKANPTGKETPRQGDPPGTVHARRYGQQTGGMHPTGMQFLWRIFFLCIATHCKIKSCCISLQIEHTCAVTTSFSL